MKRLLTFIAMAALTLFPLAMAHAAGDRGLAGQFMCQCGCGLTLASCTHAVCGPRDQMLAEIGRLTASGQTSQQIKAAFIAQYGEVVLSAPIRRGFNLVAWWGPYAAIAAGAVLLVTLGLAWSRRSRQQAATPISALSPEERALLERELETFRD